MNLNDFINEYLAWSAGVHRPATVRANALALRKFALHLGDDRPLSDIGPRHADTFMSACTRQGLKPNSANNYYRHLKAAFNKAEAWELIDKNPFAKVKQIRNGRTPPKFIPKEELAAFVAGIEDFDLRMLVTAYLATGRRRRELLNLTWDDVDLEARSYRVRSTKAHLEKDFPINDVFHNVLAQLRVKDRATVFKPWHHDTVTKKVRAELVKAGYEGFTLHTLRHSFSAAFLTSGGDLFTLKELLGHGQIGTTLIYAHLGDKHLGDAVNKVRF